MLYTTEEIKNNQMLLPKLKTGNENSQFQSVIEIKEQNNENDVNYQENLMIYERLTNTENETQ